MNYRRFRDPPNRGEIHVPSVRRPAPQRDVPLPGTKSLDAPKTAPTGFQLTSSTVPPEADFSRHAQMLGILAVVLAVVVFVCAGIISFASTENRVGHVAAIGIVAFFLTHLFAIISQAIARARFSHGLLAIILLWGGLILIVAVNVVIKLWPRA